MAGRKKPPAASPLVAKRINVKKEDQARSGTRGVCQAREAGQSAIGAQPQNGAEVELQRKEGLEIVEEPPLDRAGEPRSQTASEARGCSGSAQGRGVTQLALPIR